MPVQTADPDQKYNVIDAARGARTPLVTGDHTSAPPHGMLYYDKVKEAGTPMVQVQEVPGQSHTIMISPEGRQAVEDELTAGS